MVPFDLLSSLYKQYGNIFKLVGVVGLNDGVYLLSPEDIETVITNYQILNISPPWQIGNLFSSGPRGD